jgi:hypothetical protein
MKQNRLKLTYLSVNLVLVEISFPDLINKICVENYFLSVIIIKTHFRSIFSSVIILEHLKIIVILLENILCV